MAKLMTISERSDARANRERILRAAFELFVERGTAAEVKEIAERAGVGVGTIYRNFPTKSDLIHAIVSAVIDETDEALDRVFEIEDPAEAVRAYICTLFEALPRFAPLIMELLATAVPESLRERIMRWISEPRLAAIVERGISLGVFRADLNVAIARAFIANAADPIVYLAVRDEVAVGALAEGFSSLVLRGLRCDPAGEARV